MSHHKYNVKTAKKSTASNSGCSYNLQEYIILYLNI